jgi:hypothetical protein
VINFSNDPSDAHKKILQRGNHGRAHWETHREDKTWLTRKYKMHTRNFRTTQVKNLRRHRANKWTQRGLQQTPKWNKGHYKKRDIWNKEDNTKYKRGAEQRYGKPQEKKSNWNSGNKNSL